MDKLCRKFCPADPDDYELHVRLDGSTGATVLGDRSVNGEAAESWTNTDLLHDGPQPFTVAIGERHRLTVVAKFTDAETTVIVEIKRAGQPAALRTCELKRGAETIADMSVLAPIGP